MQAFASHVMPRGCLAVSHALLGTTQCRIDIMLRLTVFLPRHCLAETHRRLEPVDYICPCMHRIGVPRLNKTMVSFGSTPVRLWTCSARQHWRQGLSTAEKVRQVRNDLQRRRQSKTVTKKH